MFPRSGLGSERHLELANLLTQNPVHEQARKVAAEDQKLLDPNPARARAVMAEEEV